MDGRARATWLAVAALLGATLAAAHAGAQGGVALPKTVPTGQLRMTGIRDAIGPPKALPHTVPTGQLVMVGIREAIGEPRDLPNVVPTGQLKMTGIAP